MNNITLMLKPQDIVIVIKLCGYAPSTRPFYGVIAVDLKVSASEIHSAIQRLKKSCLLHGSEINKKPSQSALEKFLIYDIKYAFSATRDGMMRGMPTSYAAEPLCHLIKASSEPVPVCGRTRIEQWMAQCAELL